MTKAPFLALALVALVLAGCGSSSKKSSSTASAGGSTSTASTSAPTNSSGTVQVTMKSLAFSPGTINAKVGQTVEWTNDDSPAHNVTYVSGPKFTSSSTMNPGAKFSVKLTKAGTIHYVCTIHPFMKGTIVVGQ